MIRGRACFDSTSDMTSYVSKCEEFFELQLKNSAEAIIRNKARIVSLCGPTCSGKTTTANKLVEYLSEMGKKVHVVSFDDFYLDRSLIEYNCRQRGVEIEYESAVTLDLEMLSRVMDEIKHKNCVLVPRYSFRDGCRIGYSEYKISKDDVFIFEGIQALYPEVRVLYGDAGHYSLYISVEEGIEYESVSFDKNELRFLRRVVRDYKHRATNMEMTYLLWRGVRENEEKNIFPYIGCADMCINSVLCYEPNVIKNDAYSIFDAVDRKSECYSLVCVLREKLDCIEAIDEKLVPQRSVLREFID